MPRYVNKRWRQVGTPCIFHRVGQGGQWNTNIPEKNRQNTPKYPKFLQIYPKIIEALNTLYPKLEVSETNTYLVVLPFLAFLQMDCHYFPTITDHKKRPHVSLNGKMVGYGQESLSSQFMIVGFHKSLSLILLNGLKMSRKRLLKVMAINFS